MNKIDWCNNDREVLIYMFRYCLTRRSYAVSTAIEIITKNWSRLSILDRKLIQKEIVQHFELYSPAEKYDMDSNAWQTILELPIEIPELELSFKQYKDKDIYVFDKLVEKKKEKPNEQ